MNMGHFCRESRTVKWEYLTGNLVPSWNKVEMTKAEMEEQTWVGAAIVGRGNGKVVTGTGGALSNAKSQKLQTGGSDEW